MSVKWSEMASPMASDKWSEMMSDDEADPVFPDKKSIESPITEAPIHNSQPKLVVNSNDNSDDSSFRLVSNNRRQLNKRQTLPAPKRQKFSGPIRRPETFHQKSDMAFHQKSDQQKRTPYQQSVPAQTLWQTPCRLSFIGDAYNDVPDLKILVQKSKLLLEETKDLIVHATPWPDVWRKAIEANWVLGRINQACGMKPFSRAFFKLLEIIVNCVKRPETPFRVNTSAHIGEAPGGFFQALVYACNEPTNYRHILHDSEEPNLRSWVVSLPSDSWGNELGPVTNLNRVRCFDMITDDEQRNLLSEELKGKIDFVSGDGGFEVPATQRREQEEIMLPLLRSEVDIALNILSLGGILVLKFFAIDLLPTRCLLNQLIASFNTSSLVIPVASKPTNDERYFVGRGFIGAQPLLDFITQEWETWFDCYCMEDKIRQRPPVLAAVNLCKTLTIETRLPLEPSLSRAIAYCNQLGLPLKTFEKKTYI